MYKVYTGGTFDLFHAGHVNFLKQCRKIAGKEGEVIVAVNRDEFVERYKDKTPVISLDDRMTVLESCIYVDRVIENYGDEDSAAVIQSVMPDFVVISTDWAIKDYYGQMGFSQEWLDERDITLIYIPYTQGVSSTDIREKLRKA